MSRRGESPYSVPEFKRDEFDDAEMLSILVERQDKHSSSQSICSDGRDIRSNPLQTGEAHSGTVRSVEQIRSYPLQTVKHTVEPSDPSNRSIQPASDRQVKHTVEPSDPSNRSDPTRFRQVKHTVEPSDPSNRSDPTRFRQTGEAYSGAVRSIEQIRSNPLQTGEAHSGAVRSSEQMRSYPLQTGEAHSGTVRSVEQIRSNPLQTGEAYSGTVRSVEQIRSYPLQTGEAHSGTVRSVEQIRSNPLQTGEAYSGTVRSVEQIRSNPLQTGEAHSGAVRSSEQMRSYPLQTGEAYSGTVRSVEQIRSNPLQTGEAHSGAIRSFEQIRSYPRQTEIRNKHDFNLIFGKFDRKKDIDEYLRTVFTGNENVDLLIETQYICKQCLTLNKKWLDTKNKLAEVAASLKAGLKCEVVGQETSNVHSQRTPVSIPEKRYFSHEFRPTNTNSPNLDECADLQRPGILELMARARAKIDSLSKNHVS
eukprot:gene17921-19702_t